MESCIVQWQKGTEKFAQWTSINFSKVYNTHTINKSNNLSTVLTTSWYIIIAVDWDSFKVRLENSISVLLTLSNIIVHLVN